LLSASVSVFSSPGQMIRVVSHPEELFHADLTDATLFDKFLTSWHKLKNARKPLTAVGEENRRTAFNRSESGQNRIAMILQQPNLTVDTANLILVAFTFMWMLRGWTSSFVWHDLSDMDVRIDSWLRLAYIFVFLQTTACFRTRSTSIPLASPLVNQYTLRWIGSLRALTSQKLVVDCLLSFITFVAWRCWVDALLEGALALQMSMADNADLGGFVQRQDVTFLKKTSPYIVVVDAKDNLTQQPNSFTITEAVLWKLTFGSDAM
ncbi:hypothetical protein T4C_2388, partial [Trichinella pseudospiralis]